MLQAKSRCVITYDRYDAVLLDLDGVITDTANLHAASWKQMFDEYLRKRATRTGEAYRPFDLATDYRLYVDGKPRFDGVRDFLTSRDIQLPEGTPDDPHNSKQWAGSGTARTSLSTRLLKTWEWSLTTEALSSFINSAIANSKSRLSRPVRIARLS
jgi:beta-phosphoglucomutase-like phosphatase (HAD superfamily)